MKNYIITLISVLALALAFTGCGGSAGSTSSEITDSVDDSVENITVDTVSDDSVAIVNSAVPNVGNLPAVPVLPGQ